jgi:hypothetical protein
MPAPLSYFVLMLSHPSGDEAIVNPEHDWRDILDLVEDAASENQAVRCVDHIVGVSRFDHTSDACREVCQRLTERGEPLTDAQFKWIELHCGPQAAAAFGRRAA